MSPNPYPIDKHSNFPTKRARLSPKKSITSF